MSAKTMNALIQFKTSLLKHDYYYRTWASWLSVWRQWMNDQMQWSWSLEHESVRRTICFDWIDITNHVHLRHAAMIAIATRFV